MTNGGRNTFKIWGPNRVYVQDGDGKAVVTGAYNGSQGLYNYALKEDAYKVFTQAGLSEFANTTFKYTVGTCEVNGKVYFDATLTYTNGEEKVVSIYEDTGLTVSELSGAGYGNIVIYGTVKGASEKTTFKITKMPYAGRTALSMPSQGAKMNMDGSVTLAGKKVDNGSCYTCAVSDLNNSYIALGEYGVNTYVDFEFTGNNMPQVMLFANQVDGYMADFTYTGKNNAATITGDRGKNGYLISNGFVYDNATGSNGAKNYLTVWGPHAISPKDLTGAYNAHLNEAIMKEQNSQFAQTVLDESKTYKYTVGTCIKYGYVIIDITLSEKNGEQYTEVAHKEIETGCTVMDIEAFGKNIIAYATVKGVGVDSTFKYSTPRTDTTKNTVSTAFQIGSGIVSTAGNEVSLKGTQLASGAGYASAITNIDSGFVAWQGNYGVGNYLTFTFTGNNLPQVMFFANNINGNMTNYTFTGSNGTAEKGDTPLGNNGILLSNGFYCGGNANGGTAYFMVFGPHRYDPTAINNAFRYCLAGTNYYNLKDSLLSQDKLDANKDYKYIVGTKIVEEKVVIDIKLYDITTEKELTDTNKVVALEVNTQLTQTEAEALGKNIVVYGAVKGTANATTFKIISLEKDN